MKFYFTLKNNDEPINVYTTESIGEAIVYFANQKKLTIDDFLKIYKVKKHGKK